MMPTLEVSGFNIVIAVLGGWISLFGLVSYLLKEKFYLSEALISLLAGVGFSPHGFNFIRPEQYALFDELNLDKITLNFTRLVLGIQVLLAGVQLPSRYPKTEWKSLALLLGPIMVAMWLATSLLVWALVPNLPFLHALAIGACVTPTDPVLSNVIVKGRFADHNISKDLQKIIIAESGANDGLGYPFLFFALYLIQYTGDGGRAESGGAATAMGLWFGDMWGYTIFLSVVYGAAVGWLAKELLHYAEARNWVDRESFLVFAISLALFITGTCGMMGSDDILACFVAGNVFTWDDWFRLETLDDSLQPTIDMLLNVAVFMWYGAVCPWQSFAVNGIIPLYRLVALSILILLFRRMPFIYGLHKFIHQIELASQAMFMGFFGPIGCSAMFYLYITLEFVERLKDKERHDVDNLNEAVRVIVWFMLVSSVIDVPPTENHTSGDGSPTDSPAQRSAASSQNLSPPAQPNLLS
ncbi:hypothetical protein DL765_006164 [Monosporascus sp. GIB2]|nr:hypothetical protein DL765_006164 [Monosporascus sp. GIB2]